MAGNSLNGANGPWLGTRALSPSGCSERERSTAQLGRSFRSRITGSPGIYLKPGEVPGKPHLGDRLMKAVQQAIDSNGVPCFHMRSVGPHNSSGREKEEKKERAGLRKS